MPSSRSSPSPAPMARPVQLARLPIPHVRARPAPHTAQGRTEPDFRVQGSSWRLWIPTLRAARAWLCLFACFCGMLLRFARARVEPKSVCVRTFSCDAWTITRVSCGPKGSSWAVFMSTQTILLRGVCDFVASLHPKLTKNTTSVSSLLLVAPSRSRQRLMPPRVGWAAHPCPLNET